MVIKKWFQRFFVFLTLLSFPSSAIVLHAAKGMQGYAIYRDGAFNNFDWHAGIMNQPSTKYDNPVVHIGSLEGVTFCSFDEFLYKPSNQYIGAYEPKGGISKIGRKNVLLMARRLVTEDIAYTPFLQVDYPFNLRSQWVSPDQITALRCDGVVEYCYEWYGYRICGSNRNWDVTKNNLRAKIEHSGILVTPEKQAKKFMSLVQTERP